MVTFVCRYVMLSGVGSGISGTHPTTSSPYPSEPRPLGWIVREQPQVADSEVGEDLRSDAVIAAVGWEPQVRLASTVSRPCSCSS